MNTPQILSIVASTRPTANGPVIGRWIEAELADRPDLDLTTADLGSIGLPFLDEPHHPSDRTYVHEHTKRWSAIVDRADGFIVITPEYNRGMPAPLKNALDFLYWEWQHKPVGFVSYSGGVSGGTRAVEQAKQIVSTLAMLPVPAMVNLPRIDSLVVDGRFEPPVGAGDTLHGMADRLVDYVAASSMLRAS